MKGNKNLAGQLATCLNKADDMVSRTFSSKYEEKYLRLFWGAAGGAPVPWHACQLKVQVDYSIFDYSVDYSFF